LKRTLSRFAVLLVASLLLPLSAHAQAFRTYLASYGNDGNPCSVGSPCRLLPAALNAVLDGGEIWILDSANFNQGTVFITKNVSILAVPGQLASIASVGAAEAINVSAPVKVRLRNVVIADNANNHGTDGIVASNGANVFVEKSLIAARMIGINVNGARISVSESTFRDSQSAIRIKGNASMDVSDSRFASHSSWVIYFDGSVASTTTTGLLTNCSIADSFAGVDVYSNGSAPSTLKLSVSRTSFSNVYYGIVSETAAGSGQVALATVGDSVFSQVGVALYSGGVGAGIETMGNNQARQVGTAASGNVTLVGSI